MTDKTSTEHLSVVMTTTPNDDVTHTLGTSATASSTSRGIEFYFQAACLVIGVVGTITNGLILYALVASKQHKKKFLIFNQNALDFFSSLGLLVVYALKLCNIYLTGSSGYWLCTVIVNGAVVWTGLYASRINLVLITIERYLKVVHSNWSKKWLRGWVIYPAAAFAWIGSLAYYLSMAITTSMIIDGACYFMLRWESRSVAQAITVYSFLMFFPIPLVIMVYCYGHILVVVRRQSRVMATHDASGSNAAQCQVTQKMQSNVIKTMATVCTFDVLFNTPEQIVFLLAGFSDNPLPYVIPYYSTMFIMFLFVAINPFIYATKFTPVKRVLLDLIPLKIRSH